MMLGLMLVGSLFVTSPNQQPLPSAKVCNEMTVLTSNIDDVSDALVRLSQHDITGNETVDVNLWEPTQSGGMRVGPVTLMSMVSAYAYLNESFETLRTRFGNGECETKTEDLSSAYRIEYLAGSLTAANGDVANFTDEGALVSWIRTKSDGRVVMFNFDTETGRVIGVYLVPASKGTYWGTFPQQKK